jgi:hypothetical protein
MGIPVRVTRVTVEYAAGGKIFTVAFDPKNVDSIVLSETDLDRLKAKQNDLAKANPGVVQPVKDREPLDALRPIPSKDTDGAQTFAMSSEAGFDPEANKAPDAGRSLWWHTEACMWFHPEEQ